MYRIRAAFVRTLNLFRRRALDNDLRDQIDAHARMLEDELVAAGKDPGTARREARRALGNAVLVRETARSEQVFESVVSIATDIRLAVRRLGQRPLLTFLSVLALAAGIGTAAATWSLATKVVFRPLPAVDTDGLYVVGSRSADAPGGIAVRTGSVYPVYLSLLDTRIFESVTAGGNAGTAALAVDGRELGDSIQAFFAGPEYFETLGVELASGRRFVPADDASGAPLVAVLSNEIWRTTFAEDPDILGREITVAGQPATVIGVLPRNFRGLDITVPPDVYFPLQSVTEIFPASPMNFFSEADHQSSPISWLHVIVRLRDETDRAAAESALSAFLPVQPGQSPALVDINDTAIPAYVRAPTIRFVRFVGFAVALLLFIGCLAVGVLLLVRTESRRSELAMRLALGATRGGLARSIVAEAGLLTVVAAALAPGVAHIAFFLVRAFQLPGSLATGVLDLSVDSPALAATAGGAILAMVLISLVASSFCWSVHADDHRRAAAVVSPRIRRGRLRTLLVVGQVGIAMVLLAGAGLFTRSILKALELNPGYPTERILTGGVNFGTGYSSEQTAALLDEVRERLGAHPDIESIAMTTGTVQGMGPGGEVVVDGVSLTLPAFAGETGVDETYFSTMGLPIVAGRAFFETDHADAPPVAIISESYARVIAGEGTALGRRIRAWHRPVDEPFPQIEVVGIVPDVVINVNRLEALVMYVPLQQSRLGTNRTVVARTRGPETSGAAQAILAALAEVDPEVRIQPLRTIEAQLVDQLGPQQFGMSLMGSLSGMALFLSGVAIYVLAETLATSRRRELGVRAALGATAWQLGLSIITDSVRLVGLGVLFGLVLAWLGTGLIESLLFQIEPLDGATFLVTVGVLLAVTLLASLRPALSAMRVDPARTLREE